MNSKMMKLLTKYRDEQDGSIAIMSAICMLFLILTVGLSLDYSRLSQASARLKATSDFAALAAAKESDLTLEERKQIFEDVMTASLEYSSGLDGLEYNMNVVEDDFTVTLNVTSTSETELFFYDNLNEDVAVTVSSEVQVGKEGVEVSLVLDISSSMSGQRVIELQEAARRFVDTLLDDDQLEGRVSIALVPYGGTVKLPAELEHMLNPPETTDNWVDGTWNGCLSLPLDGTQSALTPEDVYDYLPDFTSYSRRDPWCPAEGNELVGLTDDKDRLNATIDSFSLSAGTGSDVGVMWGHAVLNPAWRGEIDDVHEDLPRDFSDKTKKIMVLMTDGGVTGQRHPGDWEMDEAHETPPFHTSTSNGYGGNSDFVLACDAAKDDGIEIFTVGFLMTKYWQITRLEACATIESNHTIADTGALEDTFENLANSISSLRVSR